MNVPNGLYGPGMVNPRDGSLAKALADYIASLSSGVDAASTAALDAIAAASTECDCPAYFGTNGIQVFDSGEIRGGGDSDFTGEPKMDVLALSSPTTADEGIVLAKRAAEHRFAFQADCPNYDVPIFCTAVMPATGTAYSVVMHIETACDGSETLSGKSTIYTIDISVDAAGAYVTGAIRALAGVFDDPLWTGTVFGYVTDDGLGNVMLEVYAGRGDPEHTRVHGSMRLVTDAPDDVVFTIYPGGLFGGAGLGTALNYTRYFRSPTEITTEITDAVAAEALLARNADNLTSGTVAEARIDSTIARDSEVSAAVAAEASARDAAIAAAIIDSIADADATHAPSRNAVYDALALKADSSTVSALVVDSIADSDTTHAPSRNAVFDALALKAPIASPTFTGTVSGITATMVGLGSVTNDAQTKAAIVPNTAPSAGQLLVGNAGGTAYAPVSASGDVTVSSTGAHTLVTAQPAVHTWALAQTFTVAPIFTDPAGSRDALKIGPRYCYEALIDFGMAASAASGTNIGSEFTARTTGAATSITAIPGVGGSAPGRARTALGTTTTGRAAVMTANDAHALGSGAVQSVCKGALESLSDGTDTYVQRIGIMDDHTAEPANGCYFRYTHSVNGGKWECVTRAAGAETATDSGVTAVAGTEKVFRVEVNAAGTSVAFIVDSTTVQTHVANIPTARVGFGAAAIRSAGTAAKNALGMDLIYARVDFTTPRW